MFRHKRSNLWRNVEKEFWELFAHSRHRDAHRHGADCKADVLTTGMMQLYKQFRTVLVNTLSKFMKSGDLIIMACAELRKRRRTVKVVYTSNFGDDKSRAALCTLLVIVHKLLGNATVKPTEAHKHRRHHNTIFDFAIADFHRRKQHFVFHNSP